MELQIISDHQELIVLTGVIPESLLTDKLITGAEKIYAGGDYGMMLYQRLEGISCEIWYSNYQMIRQAVFCSVADTPIMELHFTFKNEFKCELGGIGNILMQRGQFNLTYTPYIESRTVFAPGEYQSFDVHVTAEFLQKASVYYPLIEDLIRNIDKQKALMLSKTNHFANNAMTMIIHQILSSKYTGALRQWFTEAKVMELFLLAMEKLAAHPVWRTITLSAYDVERIHEAKNLMLSHMDNPVTLISLAHKVGTNDFKLKKGFKQLFGTTVFTYLLQARMERAEQLLTDTKMPVTEIAFTIGYQTIGSFTSAFKKYFGYPPTKIRKY